ncbi:DeoR family transcriptional regulator [Gammaproteobacteria bacterium 45_16_T64]|nr:DeoR family transcriptional regulator [Gammaproteobacteria bacterium 45_16_T64]
MSQQARHEQIVELVNAKGFVSIENLAAHFDVTPQTMRRDINTLAVDNRVRRFHGGASAAPSTQNTEYTTRKHLQSPEKSRIARIVASHIPDHASLFINIGTTNEAIAKELLNHSGLKIITNNLHVASIVSGKSDFEVIIAGGKVRSKDGGIIGEATMDFVSQFRVDYGIIGISGIDDEGSLLDFDYQEVRVSQAIMSNSREVILAADHTKFGRHAMICLGKLQDIDLLVTDQTLDDNYQTLVNNSDIRTLIATEEFPS